MVITDDKFAVLIYLLVRDCVPAGEITKIAEWIRNDDTFYVTNPHLLAFSADICQRLRNSKKE